MKYKISYICSRTIDLDNPTITFEDYCGDCLDKTPQEITEEDLTEMVKWLTMEDLCDLFGEFIHIEAKVEKV